MASSGGFDAPGDAVRRVRGRLNRAGRDDKSGAGRRVWLTGTVEQGVEDRSVVLLDGAGAPLAQLHGWPREQFRFGAEVRVVGRFVPGLSSGAQQGRPFEVESIEPA